MTDRESLGRLVAIPKVSARHGSSIPLISIKTDNKDSEQTLFWCEHPGRFIPIAGIE